MEKGNKNHDKKKAIIENYDATAFFYDKRYKEIQFTKFKRLFTNTEGPNYTILDAGCGTGLFFDFLYSENKSEVPEGNFYIGVDISKEMIIRFLHKLKNQKDIKRKISLLIADLDYLPFRKEMFDSVFSFTSLQNLPDIIQGLKELLLMAKKGGNFKLSILKKKISRGKLTAFFKGQKDIVKNIEIIDDEGTEDFLISFRK